MSAELAVAVCEGPVKALRPVGQRTAALCKWLWEEPARAVVSGTVLALWTSFHVTMLARTTRFALQPCSVPLQTWQTVEGVTGLTFSAAVTFLAFLAARTDGLLTPYGDRGEDAPTSHVLLGLGTFLLFLARLGNFIAGNALVFSSSTSSCPAASGELWRLSLAFITVNYVVFAVLLAARSLARQFSIQVLAASASATDAIPSVRDTGRRMCGGSNASLHAQPAERVPRHPCTRPARAVETLGERGRDRGAAAARAQGAEASCALPACVREPRQQGSTPPPCFTADACLAAVAIPALFLTSGAVALLAVLGMQLLCFFEAACFAATNPAVDDVTSAAIVPCGRTSPRPARFGVGTCFPSVVRGEGGGRVPEGAHPIFWCGPCADRSLPPLRSCPADRGRPSGPPRGGMDEPDALRGPRLAVGTRIASRSLQAPHPRYPLLRRAWVAGRGRALAHRPQHCSIRRRGQRSGVRAVWVSPWRSSAFILMAPCVAPSPHAAAEWARLNNSQRSLFPGGQSEIEDAFAATTGRIAGMALAQGVACLVSSLTGFVLALRIARNV